MEMEEEYIAIPVKEYEHLKRCKKELIALHEAEIVNLRNQIAVLTIYNNKYFETRKRISTFAK